MTGAGLRRCRLVVALALACLGGVLPTAALAFHKPTTVQVVGHMQDGARVYRTTFSLAKLRDLRITGWWNVRGAHVQRLEILAPDGSLYQRHTQAFKVGVTSHVNGDERGKAVRMILPVGGTWITEYSLVGEWTVHLYMDNGRTPVASGSFTLTP